MTAAPDRFFRLRVFTRFDGAPSRVVVGDRRVPAKPRGGLPRSAPASAGRGLFARVRASFDHAAVIAEAPAGVTRQVATVLPGGAA